jgi:GAF domain-containing protein
MPADREKLTINGLIQKILEPDKNIKGSSSRQQARFITLISLILGALFFIIAVIFIIVGGKAGLTISLFILTAIMAVSCFLGRSENYQAGGIILVSGIILSGFMISTGVKDNIGNIMVLMSLIVSGLAVGVFLLPILATIIISIVTIIAVGVLPMMAVVNVTSGLFLFLGLAVIEGTFIGVTWFRDLMENRQNEEIGSLRGRLEERVEERTRFTRIAAEIGREIISSKSLEDVLNKTASLATARFGFSFTGIYLADETEHFLMLKAADGQGAERMVQAGKRIDFGPPSILGWVAENRQQRVTTRLAEDPLELEAGFLPDSQSEIGIPVMSGQRVIGVLDVQSSRSTAFDNETIVVLEMLANQLATGIQNVRQLELEQGSVQEISQVYLTGYQIVQSKAEYDIQRLVQDLLYKTPYLAMFLTIQENVLKTTAKTNTILPDGQSLPDSLEVSMDELEPILGSEVFIGEGNRLNSLPYNVVRFIRQFNIFSLAIIPIIYNDKTSAALLLGTQEKNPLIISNIQPYINLSSQISTSLNNIYEAQKSEQRLTEMESINRLGYEVAQARTDTAVLEAMHRLFQETPNSFILLRSEKNRMRLMTNPNFSVEGERVALPEQIEIVPDEIFKQTGNKVSIEDVGKLSALNYARFHPELQKFLEEEASELPPLDPQLIKLIDTAQYKSAAIIPLANGEELVNLLIVGSRNDLIKFPSINFFNDVKKTISEAINRIHSEQETEQRLNQDEAIILMGQEITSIRELPNVYRTLHTHIRQTIGNVSFLVAIFDSDTNSISIPYMYEPDGNGDDTITKVESFPIGEGLTSIPIRTKQPLMLVEDTEKRASALGAKITGKPPKSWLGTPMIVADEVIGAIVIQDVHREYAFTDNDMRFLTSLSGQVAGTIYNTRLLEETSSRAVQLQTAAEIARDISGLLDLDELLNKASTLICERLHFYHAAVFLIDTMNEFAVIREATGEAGTQMKRAGHKLKVGSKSIVGYVTGSGEPLIVNDTNRDATYFANPLLPETRAEVGIPLKVGQRILGALDVQSTQAYSFVQEDVSVLRILADQMAIAVINSELFADTQEHLSQSRLLHHVTTAAASGTTLEEALAGAVQGLQVTLGGDRVSILLADKDRKSLSIKSFIGYSEEVGELKIPFGEGVTGWVAVHQQPQRINDVSQDPRYIEAGSNVHSELAVPLVYRGELLGVLNVESDQVGAYNENDEEMLGTLGGSLAAIIANARLIEQVRRQVDRERLLYDVTSKIRRSTDLQAIMTSTATELSKALGARKTQIKIGVINESADSPIQEADPSSGDSR